MKDFLDLNSAPTCSYIYCRFQKGMGMSPDEFYSKTPTQIEFSLLYNGNNVEFHYSKFEKAFLITSRIKDFILLKNHANLKVGDRLAR